MKRVWQGTALGCLCAIEVDAGELRVFRVDGILPHEIPAYKALVMSVALLDLAMRLEKHEPLIGELRATVEASEGGEGERQEQDETSDA